jgi:hypothetical protein
MPITITQVRDDLLSKLGIENAAAAPALALQDVVVAINGAMQELQRAGQEFFTQEQITVQIGAGTAYYTINQNVQSIIGPVRLNDQIPLRGMDSRGELDQFDRIFMGGTDYGAGPGQPLAYWAECNRSNGSTGDISKIELSLAPMPSAAGTLTVEAILDAENYIVGDLDDGFDLPVAQNYTESVFLPIARMLVTRSSQFSRPDILPQLTQDYARAMQTLGTAGGFPVEDQNLPERKTIN